MYKEDIFQKSASGLIAEKICVETMNYRRCKLLGDIVRFTESSIEKNIKLIGENIYKCSLELKMYDDDESASLDIVVSGVFELKAKLEPNQQEIIITKNTMAILFPYLRSQVTLLTTQPDVEPVNLPVININALLQNMES